MTSPPVEWGDEPIHPTAVIHEQARVPDSARIGPYAVIGPDVELGEDAHVGPHVLIERDTRLGAGCRLGKGAVLGTDPQDEKYGGESSRLVVGAGTTVREYATLNRGSTATGVTEVGEECLIMTYAHVAHDCRIGDRVVLANAVNMGGHVEIGDWAIVGGVTAIHQYVRVGEHAFVGGGSRVSQDVAPYCTVAGNPPSGYGVNTVGLERRDFPEASVRALREAYRRIFRSSDRVARALDEIEDGECTPEVAELVRFVRESERGVTQ
ncbi:MAG: acyl-ACP--UDP-N-acetylglucosamine O-acyltransferase [Candidatus Palauibacterales bacterium]|nr:acyl-ACP--UDP-N-acetylglucosamine O-acyltransferase [Candidatus Palauibacterales bacterium]